MILDSMSFKEVMDHAVKEFSIAIPLIYNKAGYSFAKFRRLAMKNNKWPLFFSPVNFKTPNNFKCTSIPFTNDKRQIVKSRIVNFRTYSKITWRGKTLFLNSCEDYRTIVMTEHTIERYIERLYGLKEPVTEENFIKYVVKSPFLEGYFNASFVKLDTPSGPVEYLAGRDGIFIGHVIDQGFYVRTFISENLMFNNQREIKESCVKELKQTWDDDMKEFIKNPTNKVRLN